MKWPARDCTACRPPIRQLCPRLRKGWPLPAPSTLAWGLTRRCPDCWVTPWPWTVPCTSRPCPLTAVWDSPRLRRQRPGHMEPCHHTWPTPVWRQQPEPAPWFPCVRTRTVLIVRWPCRAPSLQGHAPPAVASVTMTNLCRGYPAACPARPWAAYPYSPLLAARLWLCPPSTPTSAYYPATTDLTCVTGWPVRTIAESGLARRRNCYNIWEVTRPLVKPAYTRLAWLTPDYPQAWRPRRPATATSPPRAPSARPRLSDRAIPAVSVRTPCWRPAITRTSLHCRPWAVPDSPAPVDSSQRSVPTTPHTPYMVNG